MITFNFFDLPAKCSINYHTLLPNLDLDQDQGAVRILDEEDDVQVQEAEEDEDQEALLREVAVDQEAALFEEAGDPKVHLQDVVSVHQPLNQLKSI